MKKYVFAGLLAATLFSPAFAQSKFVAESPSEPLHRRSVVLCALALVAVHACASRRKLPGKRPMLNAGATPSSVPCLQTQE